MARRAFSAASVLIIVLVVGGVTVTTVGQIRLGHRHPTDSNDVDG